MNRWLVESNIERYGVVGLAELSYMDNVAVQMHVAMIKTHQNELKRLLCSLAEDDDD